MSQNQYIYHLKGFLNDQQVQNVHLLLSKAHFVDGRTTASASAKEVKRNLQVDPNDQQIMPQLQQTIAASLLNEPKFQMEFYASRIYPFLFSKYEGAMGYGWHVDSPVMGNPPVRTDLAMTVFLSDPASYEGGELAIRTDEDGEILFKPQMGDAIVYPCQYVHCVKDVTSGVRLAAVSWIQCSVRSLEQRALLANLKKTHEKLAALNPQSSETQSVLQVWSNLLRMWAEV